MSDREARKIFDSNLALWKVFGGDLRNRCLSRGIPEDVFNSLLSEYERMSDFIDRHDAKGNIKGEA
jgi:hypothetical protein